MPKINKHLKRSYGLLAADARVSGDTDDDELPLWTGTTKGLPGLGTIEELSVKLSFGKSPNENELTFLSDAHPSGVPAVRWGLR